MLRTKIDFHLYVFAFCLISIISAGAQNQQPPKPASNPFGGAPQMSQAQRENFPPQLLDELAAIKSAALTDDYAYRQGEHFTGKNSAPPPSWAPAKAAGGCCAGG